MENTAINNEKVSNFDSNPITNAVTGIITIIKNNPITIILLPILFGLAYAATMLAIILLVAIGVVSKIVPLAIIFVLLGLLLIGVVGNLFGGSFFVTAVKSSDNQKVEVSEAIKITSKRVFPYWGMNILIGLGTFIGLLLLIVPGIIFVGRSSLAPYIFFKENLGAMDSIKKSFELTKGHTIEMLSTLIALGLFSGGGIGLLFGATIVGPLTSRYDDLSRLKASQATKPAIHWLNYLLVFAGIVFFFFYVIYVVLAIIAGATSDTTSTTGLMHQIKQIV